MTNEPNRLITVAIHTFDRAMSLKATLEREGIPVTLQNVNLSNPVVSSGVRIRIPESSLPMALRIIENPELFPQSDDFGKDLSTIILVPVNFSDNSINACKAAFILADKHKCSITLLHALPEPSFTPDRQLSDMLSFDDDIIDVDKKMFVLDEAKRQMDIFTASLRELIKIGEIPAVGFSTEFVEGLPEEAINQYAKQHKPLMIVMGTRDTDTKERDMLGSITAEVLDTCRFPIFTLPDNLTLSEIAEMKNIIFFSNFDQEDILALDALFHLLPESSLTIKLVRIPGKKISEEENDSMLNRLGTYCRNHYPNHTFMVDSMSLDSIDKEFSRIISGMGAALIAVPNKKKNIFARLFNPGVAHRILFHSDIPMMVIPV